MTTDPLERAVIEAARAWFHLPGTGGNDELIEAVRALIIHEATLASDVREGVGWHEVAEGDELRGNNGRFYPVVRTLKLRRGKYEIVVRAGGADKVLTRPTEKDPAATVLRGPVGNAVDAFVHVFSSNAGRRH